MAVPQPAPIRKGRRDPTRSVKLRQEGRSLVNRRIFNLHQQMRQLIQEHDLPGLRQAQTIPQGYRIWTEPESNRLERSEQMLRRTVETTLATPPDWLGLLIERAVRKGVERAGEELHASILEINTADTVRFQSTAAALEVQGISAETIRRILRHVAQALLAKQRPPELMREIRRTLEKVTRVRLILLVNTAIVRSVNVGKLLAYEYHGLKTVGIEPEWQPRGFHQKRLRLDSWFRDQEEFVNVLTAGDDAVCEECEDIAAGGPYEIGEAHGLIPAHPNCRCAFTPAFDLRFALTEEREEQEL